MAKGAIPYPTAPVRSVGELADLLEVPEAVLTGIAGRSHLLYRTRKQAKRESAGWRTIDAPTQELKLVQRRVLDRVLAPHFASPIAFGAIGGRDHVAAARLHLGSRWLASLDIEDFFGSVRVARATRVFERMGFDPAGVDLLVKLTMHKGRLPQGAPSSSSLSNAVLWEFDHRLFDLAIARGVTPTRYVDDLNLSGDDQARVIETERWARTALLHEGLQVNESKCTIVGSGGARIVHGLNVGGGELSIPKPIRKWLRDAIRNVAHFPTDESELDSLRGMISYVQRFHPREADKLRENLDANRTASQWRTREGAGVDESVEPLAP